MGRLSATYGKVEEVDDGKDDRDEYIECLEQFFLANVISSSSYSCSNSINNINNRM